MRVGTGERRFGNLTSSGEECLATLADLTAHLGSHIVSQQWLIVDAVTAVEVHVDRAIDGLVSASEVSKNPVGKALLAKFGDEIGKSWVARFEWLATAFDVKTKGETFHQNVAVAIECRNAIVHGSGKLTKRQQGAFHAFIQLRRNLDSLLNVKVHGTRLVFSEDSARRTLMISREFIFGFDRAVTSAAKIDY